MGEPLEQLQRDDAAQGFQRRIRQAPFRRVFDTQGGELIDVDQHRRQNQQRQRPLGQALDFARRGGRLGLAEQEVVRVHFERFAQLGADDRQDFRRTAYQRASARVAATQRASASAIRLIRRLGCV